MNRQILKRAIELHERMKHNPVYLHWLDDNDIEIRLTSDEEWYNPTAYVDWYNPKLQARIKPQIDTTYKTITDRDDKLDISITRRDGVLDEVRLVQVSK